HALNVLTVFSGSDLYSLAIFQYSPSRRCSCSGERSVSAGTADPESRICAVAGAATASVMTRARSKVRTANILALPIRRARAISEQAHLNGGNQIVAVGSHGGLDRITSDGHCLVVAAGFGVGGRKDVKRDRVLPPGQADRALGGGSRPGAVSHPVFRRCGEQPRQPVEQEYIVRPGLGRQHEMFRGVHVIAKRSIGFAEVAMSDGVRGIERQCTLEVRDPFFRATAGRKQGAEVQVRRRVGVLESHGFAKLALCVGGAARLQQACPIVLSRARVGGLFFNGVLPDPLGAPEVLVARVGEGAV